MPGRHTSLTNFFSHLLVEVCRKKGPILILIQKRIKKRKINLVAIKNLLTFTNSVKRFKCVRRKQWQDKKEYNDKEEKRTSILEAAINSKGRRMAGA
jgi:hypothetical protein